MRTIEELERALHRDDAWVPDTGPDLAAIRGRGLRRRRARRLLAGGGGLVVAAGVLGLVLSVGGRDVAGESTPAGGGPRIVAPERMHPLADRALREIPAAVRVSPTQVVLPGPDVPTETDQPLAGGELHGETVPVGAHAYTGVTAFPRDAFPAWLHDGVARHEQTVLGDEESYPVGSTDIGILVDRGPAHLACLGGDVRNGEDLPGDVCSPALVARTGATAYLLWSMGSEDFLETGAGMELFTSDDFSTGAASTLWIGGLDGADVWRVDFVTTDGAVVEGRVAPGTVVPGESMFWANVPGELARVVAYDDAGAVVDDHEIVPCDDPVDCEVR